MATALLALALTLRAVPAGATFSTAPAAPSMSVATATLAAPTSLSAQTVNCVALTSTQVKLTWTATSSTWADGYEILRGVLAGGPYTSLGTVSGQGTTTYTDTTVLFASVYKYVVKATKLNWRSAVSNEVSFTTPTTLCA
jgi:hypothetical protein